MGNICALSIRTPSGLFYSFLGKLAHGWKSDPSRFAKVLNGLVF